jgi:hypothetical protein
MLLLCSTLTLIGIDMTSDAVWFREMISNVMKRSLITINDEKATAASAAV